MYTTRQKHVLNSRTDESLTSSAFTVGLLESRLEHQMENASQLANPLKPFHWRLAA